MKNVNIPNWKMNDFEKTIRKFARKGIKVNYIDNGEDLVEINGTQYICHNVDVYADIVYGVPGWEFIGTIEHTDGTGNIIRKVRTVEVPEKYYTAAPECEHCHTIRNRNDTFLVRNTETGDFKQVGRMCLHDYTGLQPSNCIAALSIEAYLESLEDEDENFGNYPRTSFQGFDTRRITAIIYNYIKSYGFKPSNFGVDSTKSVVSDLYYADAKANGIKDTLTLPDQEALDIWVDGLEGKTDFEWNAKLIYQSKFCKYRDLGYLCALINSFFKSEQKRMDIEIKKELSADLGYKGEVGDVITFTVKEFRVIYSTQYAYHAPTTYTYKIIDETGRIIIWSTTKDILEDEEYKGTVKAHKEFNGELETVVTRCQKI